jgi:hypothetical protein
VHSAARHQSMLCRSTTYRAQSISSRHEHVVVMFGAQHPRIGQGTWPVCGGVVVGRHCVSSGRPQSTIYCAIMIVAKDNGGTATQEWAQAPPPSPHPAHPGLRARANGGGGEYREGEGGRLRSVIENVRRASGGLRETCHGGRATPQRALCGV